MIVEEAAEIPLVTESEVEVALPSDDDAADKNPAVERVPVADSAPTDVLPKFAAEPLKVPVAVTAPSVALPIVAEEAVSDDVAVNVPKVPL